MRKDQDFEVTDRIVLTLESSDYIKDAIAQFGSYICNEVLATDLRIVDSLTTGQEVELIEGVSVKITVTKN
jgi:isoleucyl-tRNA synthetase